MRNKEAQYGHLVSSCKGEEGVEEGGSKDDRRNSRVAGAFCTANKASRDENQKSYRKGRGPFRVLELQDSDKVWPPEGGAFSGETMLAPLPWCSIDHVVEAMSETPSVRVGRRESVSGGTKAFFDICLQRAYHHKLP